MTPRPTFEPECEECGNELRPGEHEVCNHCDRKAREAEDRYYATRLKED